MNNTLLTKLNCFSVLFPDARYILARKESGIHLIGFEDKPVYEDCKWNGSAICHIVVDDGGFESIAENGTVFEVGDTITEVVDNNEQSLISFMLEHTCRNCTRCCETSRIVQWGLDDPELERYFVCLNTDKEISEMDYACKDFEKKE